MLFQDDNNNFLNPLDLEKRIITVTHLDASCLVNTPNIQDVALLIIDVQARICDPGQLFGNAETIKVSGDIHSAAAAFRKAGISTYVVYTSDQPLGRNDIDFFNFTPGPCDVLVQKRKSSAFSGTNLHEILQRAGKKRLLCCGFNLSACVKETVLDAAKTGKYAVAVLHDLTGNDNGCQNNLLQSLSEMTTAGVQITSLERVVSCLKL